MCRGQWRECAFDFFSVSSTASAGASAVGGVVGLELGVDGLDLVALRTLVGGVDLVGGVLDRCLGGLGLDGLLDLGGLVGLVDRRGLLDRRLRLGLVVDGQADGGAAAEGGQHVAHVAQLGGDAVATGRGGGELALGVAADPLGVLLGGADQRGGLGAGGLEHPGGLGRGGLAVLLGLAAEQVGALLDRGERLVLLRHLGGELGGRALAALAEGALEVGGGGGGGGALLLVVGLGLLATGGGLTGGVVDDRVGLLLGARDGLGGVDVGARAHLLGVAVGLGAHQGGVLVGGPTGLLDVGRGGRADGGGLLVGQAEHRADPLTEVGEGGAGDPAGLLLELAQAAALAVELLAEGLVRLAQLGQLDRAGGGLLARRLGGLLERGDVVVDLHGVVAPEDGRELGLVHQDSWSGVEGCSVVVGVSETARASMTPLRLPSWAVMASRRAARVCTSARARSTAAWASARTVSAR